MSTVKGCLSGMATHRQGALVAAAPAAGHATQAIAKTDFTVNVKVPDTINLLAGGIGGAVGAIVTCPLDVIKTRLQSSQYSVSSGHHWTVGHFVKHIYRTEGVRALWKGLMPTLIGVAPTRAVYFAAYHKGKTYCTKLNGGHESPLTHIGGAAFAGALSTTATNPIWVVKTRMQLDEAIVRPGSPSAHRALQAARDVYAEAGLRGFYKGLTASYAGISETIVQFVVYEKIKKMVEEQNRALNVSGPQSSSEVVVQTLAISGVAKLTACLLTYPHDVVRTRMREPYNPAHGIRYERFFQSLRDIYTFEGVPGLYSGLFAHLCRVIPNTAIMFTCYEMVVRLWRIQNEREQRTLDLAGAAHNSD